MALPTPPPYTTPIPNNPFYSVPSYLLQGATGPYVVGAGLFVDPAGTISSTGSGGAVSTIIGGTGISVSSPTGNVTLNNTGVTSLIAGSGITLTANTGNILISASGSSGTVTSITAGTGLVPTTITTSGTINLSNTGVTAATYTNPTIAVDAQGRITSASNGTAVNSVVGTLPVTVSTALGVATVSVNPASTTACGVVQLSDSTSALSSSTAATSLAVKTAFDVAVAAIPKTCVTAKGTLVTGIGPSIIASLPVGANGTVLTADSNCAEGIKWAPGGGGGGGGTVTSVATTAALTGGPIFTSGTLDLAITGVSAGTVNAPASVTVDACGRITALGAATNPVVEGDFQAKGDLISGYGVNSYGVRSVGTDGQILYACSGDPSGLCWATPSIADATPLLAGKITSWARAVGTFGTDGVAAVGNEALCCLYQESLIPFSVVNGGNTAMGFRAMKGAIGPFNTVIGQCALAGPNGNFGGHNVAVGANALKVGGGADGNVAIGANAGLAVNTGVCNVIIGCDAGCALTSGGNNVLIGTEVAAGKTIGFGGTFVGYRAGCSAGSTQDSTFVGQYAGCGASGLRNTLFGARAGCALTTGSDNVILGYGANVANPAGDTQLAIGMGPFNWLTGDSTFAIKPGAGIIDCASSCGTANMVLTSQGNAIQWKSVNSALAVPNYGSFYDTTTQTNTVGTGTGRPITLNTTDSANNFSIVSGSQVTAAVAGTYNLQFSAQFETTTASLQTIEIWLSINGSAVANSNTEFTTKGSGESYFAALNYVINMAAGDYAELIWASGDANMALTTHGSAYSGPQIPSMILTIVPVGA